MSPEEKVAVTVQQTNGSSPPPNETKAPGGAPARRRGRPPGTKNKGASKAARKNDVPGSAKGTSSKPKPTAKGSARGKIAAALRSLPSMPFQEAVALAEAIQKFAGGQPIRRLTLFQHLGKGADSSLSRALVTSSAKYGITIGHHSAEKLVLTGIGATATNPEASPEEKFQARFKLAIQDVEPFNALYEHCRGKLPSQEVMRDFLMEEGYHKEVVPQLVETFILNAKYLNLIQEIAGAERLLPVDHVLEEVAAQPGPSFRTEPRQKDPVTRETAGETTDWKKVCFYMTPIGDPDTLERRHSDLFLSHIIEPALQEFGLKVVRADAISQPGMITRQVLEYAVRARLVITDLSFHNPNVFYELCLRHVCRKPTVHLIRYGDKLPSDINQFRTIFIDNRDIYSLLPKLETYRAEIANQVRRALEDPDSVENPISTFFPGLRVTIPE